MEEKGTEYKSIHILLESELNEKVTAIIKEYNSFSEEEIGLDKSILIKMAILNLINTYEEAKTGKEALRFIFKSYVDYFNLNSDVKIILKDVVTKPIERTLNI